MKTTQRIQQMLAWTLIAALANPLATAQVPPNGVGDFTIYTASASGGAYEPNILLLIDTSDSMNLPEGWKEYPGAYDSHVEYLWNDYFGAIYNGAEVTTEKDGYISTGNGYLFTAVTMLYVMGDYSGTSLSYSYKILIVLPSTSGYSVGGSITLAGVPNPALNGTFPITNIIANNIIIDPPTGVSYNPTAGDNHSTAAGKEYYYWMGAFHSNMVVPIGSVMPAPKKPLGFWGGDTPAARQQIWQAARNYAQGTEPGDPGQRFNYRNYMATDQNTGSALYWLPAGTPETDHRLWSNAFNRFLGADRMTNFGSVNGSIDPVKRGGIDFGILPPLFSDKNQCLSSKDQLTPSTVFAPSSVPWNSGKVLGQKWQRYERYLNLDNSLASSYPGLNSITGIYYDGYLNANRDANLNASNSAVPPFSPSFPPMPMPILFQKPGNSSYGGWTDLRPDWGGVHFTDRLLEIPNYAIFNQLLALYGVSTAGITALDTARIAGYKNLAVPGYYDDKFTNGVYAGGATLTRSCNWTGQNPETDAGHTPVREPKSFGYGGTCSDTSPATITCSDPASPQCSLVPAPAACSLQNLTGDDFYTRDNNHCAWSGRNKLDTMTFDNCQWAGTRLPVPGEALGSYYYGGSCIGTCTGSDCPTPVDGGTNYCVNTTTPSQIFGANTYNNVMATADPNAGCSNRSDSGTIYYYGGSCVGDYRLPPGTVWNSNNPSACDKSVAGPMTVNGVAMTDVSTVSSTDGCTDKSDPYQSCDDRHHNGCVYQTCDNPSKSTGGSNYTVYNRHSDIDNVMVHDCLADEGSSGPFMTQLWRNFGASWGSSAGNSSAIKTLSYDVDAAKAITTAPAYDVYSVNYLNWRFGPKSNGNPIGRKTRLQIAKDAMVKLVQAQNGVRFGLMVFNRMDMTHNSEGGNIAYAVRRMGTDNAVDIAKMSGADQAANSTALSNRQALVSKINSLVAISQTPLTESLYEAYLYFRGEAPLFGTRAGTTPDGFTEAAGCDKSAFATPGGGADCTGSSGNYASPMMLSLDPATNQPAACSKNFVIMMTDGGPEGDYSANAQIKALTYTDPVSGTTIAPVQASTPSGQFEDAATGKPYGPVDIASTSYDGGYIWLDELAYYMANADMNTSIAGRQPVNTYTIGFAGADSPVLSNTAAQGNGQYYVAANASALSSALTAAVDAIIEWNPTLAAPTVPLSALNRSESAAEVFLSFFGPSSSQAWNGTVKKFRLAQGSADCGTTGGDLCLTGKSVLSGITVKNISLTTTDPLSGVQTVIVNPDAISYWNPNNIQDSSLPNKGGTGQALLDNANPSTRKVYTFITDPGAASEPVSSNADLTHSSNAVSESSAIITKSRLGNATMSNAQRATLINFIRGGNTSTSACSDAPAAGTPCTTWRSWPHADVMHSKPAIVTYDPTPTTDAESGSQIPSSQYLFYLSNDGLLHAVNAANGQEAWSFLVEETLAQIQTLNNNLSGQHLTLADGALTAWLFDANGDGKIVASDNDKVYLYFGLRRGGRAYYALDISDISSPKFLWKIDRRPGGGELCNTSCAVVADYDELGYSWSTPVAGKIRNLTPVLPAIWDGTPAVIFGGGYDSNQDNFTATAADSMGRAVYVVNGLDGSLIKAFKNGATGAVGGGSISGMNFSIPSNVSALNTDFDSQGLLDRVYVGDMAANLWRFDINDAVPASWTAKQLAALSDSFSLPTTVPNRKIMSPPVVVKQRYQGQDYDAVHVGTGDREHPLVTTSADKIIMVKDLDLGLSASSGSPIAFSSLYDITNVLQESGLNTGTFKTTSGWYLSLQSGEKVFAQPTVYYNIMRFSTFNPTSSLNACLPPGKGMLYAIDARYGGTVPGTVIAGSPSPLQMRESNAFVVATGGKAATAAGVPPTGGGVHDVVSDGALVVRGNTVYMMHCAGAVCTPEKIGTVGGATKMYWYRESAR